LVSLLLAALTTLALVLSGQGGRLVRNIAGVFGNSADVDSNAAPETVPSSTVGGEGQLTTWIETRSYQRGEVVTYHGRAWRAQSFVNAGHAPLGMNDGSALERKLLLSRREGFARNATGGHVAGGKTKIVHVTTAADRGPGSLRRALTGDQPRWIIFDGDYEIDLATGIMVGSNKTIDGRGRNILIRAPDDGDDNNWGFRIYDESNIIVHNIRFDECGDYTKQIDDDQNDCIDIIDSRDVWIDHVSLSQAADKLISITGGSRNVSVSWTHFFENVAGAFDQQVLQIGTGFFGEAVERRTTVTVHHNFFDDTGERHPVVSYGKAHAYNNYVYSFRWLGMGSQRVAQLVVEGNIFENTEDFVKDATKFEMDAGCVNGICDDREGYIRLRNNKAIHARLHSNRPELVFEPSSVYPYDLDRPSEDLQRLLVGYSGWQPIEWVPCCE
jgi:pectate lyase